MNETVCRPMAELTTLIRDKLTVAPDAEVCRVQATMQDKSPLDCVVVADAGKPLGLVMHCHLDRLLGTQFGRALYLHRPVREIMDGQAIVVDIAVPIEEAARRAMDRNDTRLYDDLIVTQEGMLRGTVSVPTLLTELSRAQGVLQLAGGAAHELNQPLQIVLGYAEMLTRSMLDGERAVALEQLRGGANRMARITRRLHNLIAGWRTVPYLDHMDVVDLDTSPS